MAQPQTNQRKQLWIDQTYQLQEVNRVILTFILLIGLQLAGFVLVAWARRQEYLNSSQAPVGYVIIAFAIPVLLCIIYCLRTIRSTHRIAGAAYRIQQDLQNVLCNPAFRFHLREGDYLQELMGGLNAVMEQQEKRSLSLDEAHLFLEEARRCVAQLQNARSDDELSELDSTLERLHTRLQGARLPARDVSCSHRPESPQQSAQA